MRLLGLALGASVLIAPIAVSAQPALSAEEVLSRLMDDSTDAQRDGWFNANAKGKVVTGSAPVFNVTPAFGLVLVNIRISERGLLACEVPKRLEAIARKVKAGEAVLCTGRIEDYERYMGAAIVNVVADNFVVGKEKIEAAEKAAKKTKP